MNETQSSSIGFTGLLTIVFIVLKLTNTITWSWWWVLAPAWIGFALWLIVVIIALIALGIAAALERN